MRDSVWSVLCVALLGCQAAPMEIIASVTELPLAEEVPREGASVRRVGQIRQTGSDTLLLEAPATARRGEVLALQLTTYGTGCVGRDTTIATVSGLRATVVPYQRVYVPPPTVGCTRELIFERRTVRVVFATVGTATIRIVGRVTPDRGLVAIERRVTVQ